MRILYVSPENVSGGFNFFVEGHRRRNNYCRFITFFKSRFGFEEDLCFNLSLMPDKDFVHNFRKVFKRVHGSRDIVDLPGNPPFWKPVSRLAGIMFILRDKLNSGRIRAAISEHKLNDFDIYHFEQGIDPYRNGRWVKELSGRGRGIVCFYHGSDLRNRGVIEEVHKHATLNLTSEIDLLDRMEGMKYLYLPIDTDKLKPAKTESSDKIRICHAARNRMFKGSDFIESTVRKLQEKYPVEWVMIENMPYNVAIKTKAGCDIFIDQVTDTGGWGYGASSVESLALGLATMTLINPHVDRFLGDHPFVSVTRDNLEQQLIRLIESKDLRREYSERGRDWVVRTHGLDAVMDCLYGYYTDAGLI